MAALPVINPTKLDPEYPPMKPSDFELNSRDPRSESTDLHVLDGELERSSHPLEMLAPGRSTWNQQWLQSLNLVADSRSRQSDKKSPLPDGV